MIVPSFKDIKKKKKVPGDSQNFIISDYTMIIKNASKALGITWNALLE